MSEDQAQTARRTLAVLPGWVFLFCGALLVTAMMLVRPYLAGRRLAWEADLLREQAQRIAQQQKAYEQFNKALADGDPVLLERLAFSYLHLQPVDKEVLWDAMGEADGMRDATALPHSLSPEAIRRLMVVETDQTVERWLHKELPRVSGDVDPYPPERWRLTRLAQGRKALGIVTAGCLLILAGLLWAPKHQTLKKSLRIPVQSD
ncbi:MAG: hypothetical protein IT443_05625 [Phycisphaeraceae bacterium]|nr:hypothetical protein [Phycisphaeraceae bacterium]